MGDQMKGPGSVSEIENSYSLFRVDTGEEGRRYFYVLSHDFNGAERKVRESLGLPSINITCLTDDVLS